MLFRTTELQQPTGKPCCLHSLHQPRRYPVPGRLPLVAARCSPLATRHCTAAIPQARVRTLAPDLILPNRLVTRPRPRPVPSPCLPGSSDPADAASSLEWSRIGMSAPEPLSLFDSPATFPRRSPTAWPMHLCTTNLIVRGGRIQHWSRMCYISSAPPPPLCHAELPSARTLA